MKRKKKLIIILIILLILVGTGIILSTFRIKDSKIEVVGNEKYTKEEIIDYIFKSDWDRNPFVLYYKTNYKEQKTIPFVDEYDVEIKSLHSVKITIYEKSIIGYVSYMGYNMYFDKDGTVVESSDKILENIPKITGLKYDNIILNELLPVENSDVFSVILDITQSLQKYSITVDKLNVSDDNEYSLYWKDVVIELGKGEDLNEKIKSLSDMLPNLEGLKGVLDMKIYDDKGAGYTFKKSE